jgi:hypothetical protein
VEDASDFMNVRKKVDKFWNKVSDDQETNRREAQ